MMSETKTSREAMAMAKGKKEEEGREVEDGDELSTPPL